MHRKTPHMGTSGRNNHVGNVTFKHHLRDLGPNRKRGAEAVSPNSRTAVMTII